ncbi:MAG: hypothetical protein JW715_04445 [Sedimentisphaerales bacterium]|nr:hypothetical protein [Sedimentisphaerales bacterium]
MYAAKTGDFKDWQVVEMKPPHPKADILKIQQIHNFGGQGYSMTIKKLFFILCLVILLCAAKLAYDKYYGPAQAVSSEQEEAAKLKQLEADLLHAAAVGRGDYKRPASTGSSTKKVYRTRRTGST